MKVDVVPVADLGAAELSTWSQVQHVRRDLASPFLSSSFAAACARVRPRTRVAVVTDENGVTGFFPFESGRAGFGAALGKGFSDLQGLVAPDTAEIDPRALLRACGLRAWEFDHLIASQSRWLAGAPHRWAEDSSPVVDLTGGWAAYEQALRKSSSSLQSTTARRRRGLERDHGPVTLTFDDPDHAVLDTLLTWKSDQYRRTGRRDVFAEPAMRRLVHDLLDSRDPGFAAPLTVLRAGDEIVAAHLGLRSPTVLAWWFPVYATRFSRYSPGLILCLDILRAMSDEGVDLLDLGKGEESYKQRLANAEIPLLHGAVARDALSARLIAARHWPRERARAFLREHPDVRSRVRGARLKVATTRMTWSAGGGQPE